MLIDVLRFVCVQRDPLKKQISRNDVMLGLLRQVSGIGHGMSRRLSGMSLNRNNNKEKYRERY